MKLKAQRSLLHRMAGLIAPALKAANDPMEKGQYIKVKAGNNVCLSIGRNDIVAKVQVGPCEGMSIVEQGFSILDGAKFNAALSTALDCVLDVSPILPATTKSKKKAGASASPVAPPETASYETGGFMSFKENEIEGFALACSTVDHDATIGRGADKSIKMRGADFAKYAKAIGLAIGAPNGNEVMAAAMIRVKEDGVLEMATHNEKGQFAWLKLGGVETSSKFETFVPYELLETVAKMVDVTQDVVLEVSDKLVVAQKFSHGGALVGDSMFQIPTSNLEFPDFEGTLNSLSFTRSFNMSRQQAIKAFAAIKLFDQARMTMTFDPSKPNALLTKLDAQRGGITKRILPLSAIEGSTLGDQIELDVSGEHMYKAIQLSESEEIPMMLSGEHSIGVLTVDDNLKMYFMPYGSVGATSL